MGNAAGVQKGHNAGLQARQPGVVIGAKAFRKACETPGPVPHVIAVQVSESVLDRIRGGNVVAVPGPEPGSEPHSAGPLALTQLYFLYFPYQVPIGGGFL
ncbi:MAG TPA: hypothetical protein VMB35_04610 [Methanomicrobiales archaeon]|nr:hypothetical protein [Methanomicrobiales archaeon]